jgi:hypothetical protein
MESCFWLKIKCFRPVFSRLQSLSCLQWMMGHIFLGGATRSGGPRSLTGSSLRCITIQRVTIFCFVLQSFAYVRSKATLYDTISSGPGYLCVSDKEYNEKYYHFQTNGDVLTYWTDLEYIAVNTPLGKKAWHLQHPSFFRKCPLWAESAQIVTSVGGPVKK